MSSYPYSPLNLPFETRILTVYPGSEDDDLKCSLSHMKISSDTDETIEYETLSYCWSKCTDREPPTPSTDIPFAVYYPEGKVTKNFYEQFQEYLYIPGFKSLYYQLGGRAPEGTILCDDVSVHIGGELCAALKQLRAFHVYHNHGEFKIWVDAVCINQEDVGERNEHVKIMNKIYGGASHVRIWLGEEFGKEYEAIEAIEEVNKLQDLLIDEKGLKGNRVAIQEAFYEHEGMKEVDWEALSSVLCRSWFRRLWVLQEVANAKAASIHIGRFPLRWSDFSRAIQFLLGYTLDGNMDEAIVEIQNTHTLAWVRESLHYSETGCTSIELLRLLGETKSFKSTHAVDKLYGIISLFPDDVKAGIEVDYSSSAEDTFIKFTIDQLQKNPKLDILNYCTPPTEPKRLNLPSWVPDWTQPNYTEPFCLRYLESNAAGDTKPKFTVDKDGKTLRISGKLVDTIAQVEQIRIIPSRTKHQRVKGRPSASGSFPSAKERRKIQNAEWLEDDRRWHSSVVQMVTRNLTRPVPPELWRVFMCNQTRENEVPDDSCELGFQISLVAKSWDFGYKGVLDCFKKAGEVPDSDESDLAVNEFVGAFNKWCYNRRFYETKSGLFGWAMDGAQAGDEVCVLYGGEYPFVMRPIEGGRHSLVSDCYIHGFMDGEALSENLEEREFIII